MGAQVTIYALLDPRTDEVRYIGQSIRPAARLAQHRRGWGSGPAKLAWVLELEAQGLAPRMETLAVVEAHEANHMEQQFINAYRLAGAALTNGRYNGAVGRRAPRLALDTWDAMVRLPDELGREVEDLATEEMMPVAVMLRHLVRDGVKYRKGRRRGQ